LIRLQGAFELEDPEIKLRKRLKKIRVNYLSNLITEKRLEKYLKYRFEGIHYLKSFYENIKHENDNHLICLALNTYLFTIDNLRRYLKCMN
jgi:hypothetical protein